MPEPTILATSLEGVLLVKPSPVIDDRGFFVRTMSADVLQAAGIDPRSFVQENQSRSRRGTLRGLHMRKHLSEAKLTRCARGRVFEIVVDLRLWSSTFGRWEQFWLDDESHHQVYVPPGCAHGFQVVSDWADICYKHDAYYAPELDAALAWDDPELSLPWPLRDPILSERDQRAPSMAEIRHHFSEWYGAVRPS